MGGFEELLAGAGFANMASQTGAAGATAATAAEAATGTAGMASGAVETAGALAGNPSASLGTGIGKMAGSAMQVADAQKGLEAGMEAAGGGMLDKMKEIGGGFLNGLTTGDKVFTSGADGVDWTQTLSKAAGRTVQTKLNRALGGDARWKMQFAKDFYDNYAG